MQTTGEHPTPGAAPFRYGTESRQRHIIERLTQAILFETLLIIALIVFVLYQQYRLNKPDEVITPVAAATPTDNMQKKYVPAAGGPDGEILFDAKCSACHYSNSEPGTGPGLAGATDRVPSRAWLHKWVQNPAGLINSGDAYALKIYEKYKPTMMPPQNLTEAEIDAVFTYVEAVNQ
jgi:mono/diheme cytochrome c family protein